MDKLIKAAVIVADDEPVTRLTLRSILHTLGFDVRMAQDGSEGSALIDAMKDEPPALLITDYHMPGCSGAELAEYARQHFPQIKVIHTSGIPHPALLRSINADPHARCLGKPFTAGQLRVAMSEMGLCPEIGTGSTDTPAPGSD